MRAKYEAIKAQGDAFIDLAEIKKKDAAQTLANAGIEEKTGDEGKKRAEETIFIAQRTYNLLADLQKKRYKERVDEFIKSQVAIYKAVEKLKQDLPDLYKEIDDESADFFDEHLKQKAAEYENRLLKAKTQGGDTGAQEELIRIGQEEINILKEQLQDVELYKAAYEANGESAVEVDNRRLQALLALQEAERKLHDAQDKSAKDAIKNKEEEAQMSFQSAQQLAGALGDLSEAAGASAGVTAMLAIAESAAAMGAALHKAFSSSATVWDGIAGAVAAIATITTIISQIKSLNSSAEDERVKYKYASGGLVVGPGTGTSDSIPARLSNGEAVMTAAAVSDWGSVLSAINVSSGGRAIDTSRLPERGDGMQGMERMMERALLKMPAPVVLVKDIDNGQRRVRVAERLGKLGGRKK